MIIMCCSRGGGGDFYTVLVVMNDLKIITEHVLFLINFDNVTRVFSDRCVVLLVIVVITGFFYSKLQFFSFPFIFSSLTQFFLNGIFEATHIRWPSKNYRKYSNTTPKQNRTHVDNLLLFSIHEKAINHNIIKQNWQ